MARSQYLLSFALTVLFISCQKPEMQENRPGFTGTPEVSQDISNLNIRAFYEDTLGHIWIGTDRGLNRFTGKEYYQYFSGESSTTINNNKINNFLAGPDGRFWIATASGPAYYTEQDGFHRVEVEAEVGYRASWKLIGLESGDIVMSSMYGVLFRYDSQTDRFIPIRQATGGEIPISFWLVPARGSYFWCTANGRLAQVDAKGVAPIRFFDYPFPNFRPFNAIKDNFSRLWLYDSSHICCFDTEKGIFVSPPIAITTWAEQHSTVRIYFCGDTLILQDTQACWFYSFADGSLVHQDDERAPYALPAFHPSTFLLDSNNHLWVGSIGHGFTVCSGHKGLFNQNAAMVSSLQDINVKSLDVDAEDRIWMVASENQILQTERSGSLRSYDNSPFLIPGDLSEQLEIARYDRRRNGLWLGTSVALFFCKLEGNQLKPKNRYPLPSVPHVVEFSEDAVYAGLDAGNIVVIRPESGKVETLSVGNRQIRDIHRLHDGKLIILIQMDDILVFDPTTGKTSTIPYREQMGELFHLLDVCEDRLGNLWFATQDFGLIMMSAFDNSFHFVPGTSCNTLTAVEVDQDDRLWVSSAYGLNMVSIENENVVRYFKEDGTGGNQFNVRASTQMSDGTVIFGGTHGITTCHLQMHLQQQAPPLYFEGLSINGESVSPHPKGPLPISITHTPQITLRHGQNNLSVSFAALDYPRSLSILYQYKLEGYDKYWTSLGNENRARFSSLPPGRYKLRVSARNVGEEPVIAELPVRVKPAPLASPGAILFYFVALFALIWSALHFTNERVRLNLQLAQSEREKEHEQIVNKVNMNFFADMAHEFRSPLTMIKGPMTQLLEDRSVRPENHKLLHVMNLSVERMVKLVDQLLNFNKLDNNKLKLAVVKDYDIVAHTLKIVEMSSVTAVRRGINMQRSGLEKPCYLPLDPDKYESILSNLMSNALKFAGNDGNPAWIGVHFESNSDQVHIRVENSSRLFDKEEMSRIFDRYYQAREHAEHAHLPGTGIGLNFAWMLAERMHGSLTAENLPDGSGVRFTLSLPAREDAFTPEEFAAPTRKVGLTEPNIVEPVEEGVESHKQQTILVVDDDIDIANYLSILLSPYYNVAVANDVPSANELIYSKEMPDVILSDIVMPGEDGISFCQSIKSNILTCHIPVILVTAKVGVRNEVEGLESGADAYVTKPFDPVYMLALIKSMLKNRNLLKGELAKTTRIADVQSDLLSQRDAAFLDQLYKIMEEEMANPELDIQKICDRMCVSRTKLFYKVKSLTGMSTATIFRTFRLNMAAQMLREGNDNISEVAYKVGFNSPSYFTRAFKAQFGILPKDIANG